MQTAEDSNNLNKWIPTLGNQARDTCKTLETAARSNEATNASADQLKSRGKKESAT